ncbi:hypothetical protein [Singulisphaera acidiphila]|uniref:Uncharacterized protein n=1 Tax=Singulisphaera acidiphila (strain ATCC BAA-1392 / DSM 18658 / VKM B-2454 / MOB10) TaxID=886293 RepID=L0DIC0_SINAD|nr:hypothetical protein [Singulisphaera acidiphila]AGA28610.1 hypothetical protein Sinac_4420 [Singulisphaera acidiphila DSM 18658]
MNDAIIVASAGDEPSFFFISIIVAWIALVVLAMYIATQKGRSAGEAVMIAGLFGPLGVIVVALLPTLNPRLMPGPIGSSTMPTSNPGKPKNPAYEDWSYLMDWSNVKTDDDEKKARKEAYNKYLKMFGPKMNDIAREGDTVRFNCLCGFPTRVPIEKAGTTLACSSCGIHFISPTA